LSTSFIKELINHIPNSRLKPCSQYAPIETEAVRC